MVPPLRDTLSASSGSPNMQPIESAMPWQLGPAYPRWTETLRDQRQVVIRPVRPGDAAAE